MIKRSGGRGNIKLLLEKKLLRISIIFTIAIIVAAFILYFLLKKLMLI